MEDEKIVELYLERNETAIEKTSEKYGKRLRSLSKGIVKDAETAEECENDTYMAAWDQIPPTKPQVFSAFLSRITRNLSFKKLRANTAQKRGGGNQSLPIDELANLIPDNTNAISELEITEILNAFLRELPTRDRQVFLCHYWYCDSIKDISRQFGFTQSKVKMILLRTRQKLLDRLEQQEVFL